MRSHSHRGWVPAGIALVFGLAGAADAAQEAARVTAAVGPAQTGDAALEAHGALGEGAGIETGKDGNCSLLVDEDALMELCGDTSLRLERKGGDPKGPRVVKLDRGEIRMVVEPRLGEERIEIHTPAAIATILGTILHVSVDALGVTTVTSSAARVLVGSSDPAVKSTVTIGEGQQVVVEPGQAPTRPVELDKAKMAALGGCLIDFHGAALDRDRSRALDGKIDEAVQDALEEAAGPDVSLATEDVADSGLENVVNDIPGEPSDPQETLTQVDIGVLNDVSGDGLGPPVGGGIGGGDIPGVGDGEPVGGDIGGGQIPGVP
jgi:hypothetical protein